jgi:deazaflavin-dependent oxidoreductase (nitroreductase family)
MLEKTAMRMISGTHEFWYRLTGGLIGGRFGRLPILLLTTTGRKSGKKRTTPLVYLPYGENMVIIASNGGSDRHPEWWLNLRADPTAKVQVGPDIKAVTAEKAQGAERDRLWREVNELYHGYDEYQRSTKREIPVVVLRPEGQGR